MGTYIKIVGFKGDNTPASVWETFVEKFREKYDGTDIDVDGEIVSASPVSCPYSCANIHSAAEGFEEFKDSGIGLELYYLEKEPDELIEL